MSGLEGSSLHLYTDNYYTSPSIIYIYITVASMHVEQAVQIG